MGTLGRRRINIHPSSTSKLRRHSPSVVPFDPTEAGDLPVVGCPVLNELVPRRSQCGLDVLGIDAPPPPTFRIARRGKLAASTLDGGGWGHSKNVGFPSPVPSVENDGLDHTAAEQKPSRGVYHVGQSGRPSTITSKETAGSRLVKTGTSAFTAQHADLTASTPRPESRSPLGAAVSRFRPVEYVLSEESLERNPVLSHQEGSRPWILFEKTVQPRQDLPSPAAFHLDRKEVRSGLDQKVHLVVSRRQWCTAHEPAASAFIRCAPTADSTRRPQNSPSPRAS